MALPKNRRIKKKKDLETIFKKGRGLRSGFLLIKCIENNLSFSRGAVIVPSTISSKATERNKIKRRVGEALSRLLKSNLSSAIRGGKTPIDFVVVAQKGVLGKNFKEITTSLRDIFIKANIA